MTPKEDSRICSEHFVDKKPTLNNPYPTLNLGYTTVRPITTRHPPKERPQLQYKKRKINLHQTKVENASSISVVNETHLQSVIVDHGYCITSLNSYACVQKNIEISNLEEKTRKLEFQHSVSRKDNSASEKVKQSFKISEVLKSDKKKVLYWYTKDYVIH